MLMLDRVLEIDELQDQIRMYLTYKDVKTCTLVSRQWSQYWGRLLWSQMRLQQHHYTNTQFLERQGVNIQRLSCEFVTPPIIASITLHCPTLRSLYLHLDRHSGGVSSEALEEMFLGVGMVRLTRVHVRFDIRWVDPMRLWGLRAVKGLKELYLDPYCSGVGSGKVEVEDGDRVVGYYSRGEYMSILHVCEGLESFICGGCFLQIGRSSPGQESRSGGGGKDKGQLQVDKKGSSSLLSPSANNDRGPENLFTMLSRRLSSSFSQSNLISTTPPSKPETMPPQSIPSFEGYSLRRLHVQSSPLDVTAFHHLGSLCPFLEELTISRAQGASFTPKTWILFSRFCPRLRTIRLENDDMITQHMPDLGDVVMKFPVLESLELVDCGFERDPDLVALGKRLQDLKVEQGGRGHPLKRLSLTGAMSHSTRILADALVGLEAVSLESLTVGKTSSLLPSQRQQQGTNARQVLEWDEPLVDFTVPWTCFETLTLLDFTKVAFPKNILKHFFSLVAQSTTLHSLGIAWSQLLSLYTTKSTFNPLSNRREEVRLLEFQLPYLRKVAIGCGYNRRRLRECTLSSSSLEVLLKAAPSVRKVGVRTGVEVEVEGVRGGRLEGWRDVFLGVEFVYLTPSQAFFS